MLLASLLTGSSIVAYNKNSGRVNFNKNSPANLMFTTSPDENLVQRQCQAQ